MSAMGDGRISRDGSDNLNARLIKLLIKARRFNTILVGSDNVPCATLAKREGVSPSYFTRLVRLSYLARTSRKPCSMAISPPI